jgi:hypothetical protein
MEGIGNMIRRRAAKEGGKNSTNLFEFEKRFDR